MQTYTVASRKLENVIHQRRGKGYGILVQPYQHQYCYSSASIAWINRDKTWRGRPLDWNPGWRMFRLSKRTSDIARDIWSRVRQKRNKQKQQEFLPVENHRWRLWAIKLMLLACLRCLRLFDHSLPCKSQTIVSRFCNLSLLQKCQMMRLSRCKSILLGFFPM